MSESEILRMLDAFAGPELPSPSAGRSRRRVTRRSLLVLAAVIVTLTLAVPTSFALLGGVFQSPEAFVADTNQPLNARQAIQRFLDDHDTDYTLNGILAAVTADTPAGEYGVYALRFDGGVTGTAVISSTTGGVAAMSWGTPARCRPPASAVEPLVSFVDRPGRTPAYVAGHVSDAVASVEIVYPDGFAIRGATANGYFLAWVDPREDVLRAEGIDPERVELVARDAGGAAIGELEVGARTGFIPLRPGASPRDPSCG